MRARACACMRHDDACVRACHCVAFGLACVRVPAGMCVHLCLYLRLCPPVSVQQFQCVCKGGRAAIMSP